MKGKIAELSNETGLSPKVIKQTVDEAKTILNSKKFKELVEGAEKAVHLLE